MMQQDTDDEDIPADYMKKRSNSFSSLKKRLSGAPSFSFSRISSDYKKRSNSNSFSSFKKRLLSAPSFSLSGCRAGSSLSVKGPNDVARLCNSELSRRDYQQPDETALISTNSPCKRENSNLNQDVEDVNKMADAFIAKMKERLKIEKKVSEMEYIDRIQRGVI